MCCQTPDQEKAHPVHGILNELPGTEIITA